MKANVERPSQMMLEWMTTTGKSHDWSVMLADLFGGTHVNNPYHNHRHMLMVAWYAMHAWNEEMTQEEATNTALSELIYSACVHDHGHSGGYYKNDMFNIDVVRDYLLKPGTLVTLRMLGLNTQAALRVENNVLCTRFDAETKTFPLEPHGAIQKALRDADLMMVYSSEGRGLVIDLYEELTGGQTLEDADDVAQYSYMTATVDFLTGAKMYTSYGKRMKRTQLRRALNALAYQVVSGKTLRDVQTYIKSVMDDLRQIGERDQVNNQVNTTND